eukprot:CAMPEP_0176421506 /NCGR_PEP_ID=MMETSP0127-20121128/9210_1 /TAXON_ID=938130 /ORGANISM="Platyophrya macrostoma, Strain WH" /LENGTH=359 /DNA_ID=CAMNT_0017802241 /DNA_START=186 /DNA_END=1265 /DNA_ORIENTATION=+
MAVAACASLYVSYRTRLLIGKWRKNERARLIQKYRNNQSAATSASPSPQRCDPTDSGIIEIVDPTVVTVDDLEEFHMALGLMQPRDEDLILLVDDMLLNQAIPAGWILYRTTGGYIRFRELNTEELTFFHPGARELERLVRSGVASRNQADMEFQFGDMSRGVSTSGHGEYDNDEVHHAVPNADFEDSGPTEADSEKEAHMFNKLLNFFVDKEKESAAMEVQIQESFRPSRAKRSSSRRGTQLTPSLRVTTTVPLLRMNEVRAVAASDMTPSPKRVSVSPNVDNGLPRSSSTASFQSSLPPKRPPTPRNNSSNSAVRPDRAVPSSTTSSSSGIPPRVPSFRAPPRTPSSASLGNSVVLQ